MRATDLPLVMVFMAILCVLAAPAINAAPAAATATTKPPTATAKPFPLTRQCDIQFGNEVNEEDDSCETFYACADYVGVLSKCPGWWQFHHDDLVCKNNSDVWCQYQMQLLEEAAAAKEEEEEALAANAVAKQRLANEKAPKGKESEDEYGDEYDYNYNQEFSGKGDKGAYDYNYDDEYDYQYGGEEKKEKKPSGKGIVPNIGPGMEPDMPDLPDMPGDYDYPGVDDEDYECETEYGHEPNLGDFKCSSFFRCDEFVGSLIECKEGLVYDYKAKACREQSDVSCRGQMAAFMQESKPARKSQKPKWKKVGKKERDDYDENDDEDSDSNEDEDEDEDYDYDESKEQKEDNGLTIVHHFYHGNTKPNSKNFQDGPGVRHVFVSKKRSDAYVEPTGSRRKGRIPK